MAFGGFVQIIVAERAPIGVMKREWNNLRKGAFRWGAMHWRDTYLAVHFTHAGATKYHYTPRKGERGSGGKFKGSYTQKKLRMYGHTNPLVLTGRTRSEVMSRRDVRSTRYGARVVLHGNTLNFKNPNSDVNMRDEITRVTDDEVRAITQVIDRQLLRGVKRIRERRVTRL